MGVKKKELLERIKRIEDSLKLPNFVQNNTGEVSSDSIELDILVGDRFLLKKSRSCQLHKGKVLTLTNISKLTSKSGESKHVLTFDGQWHGYTEGGLVYIGGDVPLKKLNKSIEGDVLCKRLLQTGEPVLCLVSNSNKDFMLRNYRLITGVGDGNFLDINHTSWKFVHPADGRGKKINVNV